MSSSKKISHEDLNKLAKYVFHKNSLDFMEEWAKGGNPAIEKFEYDMVLTLHTLVEVFQKSDGKATLADVVRHPWLFGMASRVLTYLRWWERIGLITSRNPLIVNASRVEILLLESKAIPVPQQETTQS